MQNFTQKGAYDSINTSTELQELQVRWPRTFSLPHQLQQLPKLHLRHAFDLLLLLHGQKLVAK